MPIAQTQASTEPFFSRALPPANRQPLSGTALCGPEWADHEREFLRDLCSSAPLYALLCSGSKVDVGLWMRRGRIRVACLESELLLFAFGPKPFSERYALADLRGSIFNHITGELVLAPADGMPMRTLRLPQQDALQLLAQIYR